MTSFKTDDKLYSQFEFHDPSSSPVLGPVLLHVRGSRVRGSPTLVPPCCSPLLPWHHLLLPLLPLLSRATQQAGGQLVDGGELAKSEPVLTTSQTSFFLFRSSGLQQEPPLPTSPPSWRCSSTSATEKTLIGNTGLTQTLPPG